MSKSGALEIRHLFLSLMCIGFSATASEPEPNPIAYDHAYAFLSCLGKKVTPHHATKTLQGRQIQIDYGICRTDSPWHRIPSRRYGAKWDATLVAEF